ncbi:MAG: hypothetical protein QXJ48_04135 [Candidatus Korarchaeum sp.]
MGIVKLLASILGSEGFSLIGFHPPGQPSEEVARLVVKAFPMSASGGEVVKFKHAGLNFVGCTLRLAGEKPRQGIASIVAITDDEGEVGRIEVGLLKVSEALSSRADMTSDRLKDILPDVFKYLAAFRLGGEETEEKRAGALDKAVERSRGFFMM